MQPDRRGASAFVFIVLFGVVLALMIGGILAAFYVQQLDARVGLQAQSLADELAKTAVSSLGGGQPALGLPTDVGGSEYRISIEDNRVFVVQITAGRLKGNRYTSHVGVDLRLENAEFAPGGKVFFQQSAKGIVLSASPIEEAPRRYATIPDTPPRFYDFAKDNPREAAAIAAGYFHALDMGFENIDAIGYTLEGDDVLVQIGFRGWENLFGVRVSGYENDSHVGHVGKAWIVTSTEKVDNFPHQFECPSIENAWKNGWFYSPSQALNYLRSRAWRRSSDNAIVSMSATPLIRAAAATTNVSTYPTWRIEFDGQVLHYRAMPWWWKENTPGFVFQSEPKLETS